MGEMADMIFQSYDGYTDDEVSWGNKAYRKREEQKRRYDNIPIRKNKCIACGNELCFAVVTKLNKKNIYVCRDHFNEKTTRNTDCG